MNIITKIIIRIVINLLMVIGVEKLYFHLHTKLSPFSGTTFSVFIFPSTIVLILLFILNMLTNKISLLNISLNNNFLVTTIGLMISIAMWIILASKPGLSEEGLTKVACFFVSCISLGIVLLFWLIVHLIRIKHR